MNRRKILSNSEISAFCGQLSLIVKAGISLQEGLLIMAEDDKNGRGGEIIEKLTDVMEAGRQLCGGVKGIRRISRLYGDNGGDWRGVR